MDVYLSKAASVIEKSGEIVPNPHTRVLAKRNDKAGLRGDENSRTSSRRLLKARSAPDVPLTSLTARRCVVLKRRVSGGRGGGSLRKRGRGSNFRRLSLASSNSDFQETGTGIDAKIL